ncbi:SBF-like CPA transporter family-domain-containing protein [Pilobolus umbonatus]|nr:SBF-like CPA transporter family-domain-containing protein [Pilobolus umbonatus]
MSGEITTVKTIDKIHEEDVSKESHIHIDDFKEDQTTIGYVSDSNSRKNKIKATAKRLFLQYWFLLGLGIAIGLAWAFPHVGKAHGALESQYSIKWGAVIVIFLLSGLGLETSVMIHAILQWRLHLTIQVINFFFLPFLMYGFVRFFIAVNAQITNSVYKGWMIALATSTTVSSNVIMTRNANGNEAAALFNAALGNIMGIFLSPVLMTAFQDDPLVFEPGTERGNPDYLNVLKVLGSTVLAPLVIGQLIRFFFPVQIKKLAAKCRFPIINSLALLLLVWSVFCDGVASDAFKKMTGVDIVAIIFVDILMYLIGCSAALFVARIPWPHRWINEPQWVNKLRFSKKDSIAVMYCSATKTVSMGIPLINVLYADSSYGVVGVLSLPLLMYHICQLFIGNFQVIFLKKWVAHEDEIIVNNDSVKSDGHGTALPLSAEKTIS